VNACRKGRRPRVGAHATVDHSVGFAARAGGGSQSPCSGRALLAARGRNTVKTPVGRDPEQQVRRAPGGTVLMRSGLFGRPSTQRAAGLKRFSDDWEEAKPRAGEPPPSMQEA
jgi:hypothetical protein